MGNPTTKTGRCQTQADCKFHCASQAECRLAQPEESEEMIMPVCPSCDAEITAASVQINIIPNPKPPLMPQMLVTMVVCRACRSLLPMQVTLLVDPTAAQQQAPPPASPPSKIWTPH